MKKLRFVLLFFLLFKLFTFQVIAESSYVLPYPSAMPGNIFYKINIFKNNIFKFWYFGDFGKLNYNLKESDKYLVEAKTLFDYKQYLLGHKALVSSDIYFKNIKQFLVLGKNNGKNISGKEKIFKEAAEKHIEELRKIKNNIPESILWTPEKEKPTKLFLWESIDESVAIRQESL